MPKPVKLSDSLYAAAREAAGLSDRSLSSQIEHWATLGRAIEDRLTSSESAQLKTQVREPAAAPYATAGALQANLKSALLNALKPATQATFAAELAASPLPRYSTDSAFPGCLVLENPDGTRTPGTWINGRFEPLVASPHNPRADVQKVV
jgi:hypothetical protein